jgi:hypothetical protein
MLTETQIVNILTTQTPLVGPDGNPRQREIDRENQLNEWREEWRRREAEAHEEHQASLRNQADRTERRRIRVMWIVDNMEMGSIIRTLEHKGLHLHHCITEKGHVPRVFGLID